MKYKSTNKNLIKFLLLGLPTWSIIDGIWSSLSSLVNTQPEEYSISSSLILALTLGNFISLILGLGKNNFIKRFSNKKLCHILIFIYCFSICLSIILINTYKISVKFGSNSSSYSMSLPLLIIFFFEGSIASLLNLIQFSLVSSFYSNHTSYLATGIGIGSMISGILGLLRGLLLEDENFSLPLYYGVITLLYLPAIYSACTLEFKEDERILLDQEDKFYIGNNENKLLEISEEEEFEQVKYNFNPMVEYLENQKKIEEEKDKKKIRDDDIEIDESIEWKLQEDDEKNEENNIFNKTLNLSIKLKLLLLFHCLNSLFGFGFIPSIISYTCFKFDNSNLILLFSTGFAAAIDPIFKFLTNFYQFSTIKSLILASIVLYFIALCLILCTIYGIDSPGAGAIPVLLYISFGALFGFTSTCFYRILKIEIEEEIKKKINEIDNEVDNEIEEEEEGIRIKSEDKIKRKRERIAEIRNNDDVQTIYRWAALISQTGSMIGSIITFFIVTYEVF